MRSLESWAAIERILIDARENKTEVVTLVNH